MPFNEPIQFRLSTNNDLAFIYSSWSGYDKATTQAHLTPHNIFKSDENQKITYLLCKSNTMIAYLENEVNTIIGYITYQYLPDTLLIHFAFVKPDYRKLNIETELLKLVNILNTNVVLTFAPEIKTLKQLQKDNDVIYDHFYFSRGFFNV